MKEARPKRTNAVWYEVVGIIKFAETGSGMGVPGKGAGGEGQCLIGTEFPFGKVRKFWGSAGEQCA